MRSGTRVFFAALKAIGIKAAAVRKPGRTQDLVCNKRMIVGAIRELSYPRMSYPAISTLLGRNSHSAARHQHKVYLTWPKAERDAWIQTVISHL